MANEHPSGLPNTFDRATNNPDWQGVVFTEERFLQGAELNELQTIARKRHDRLGRLVAADGNRVEGASAIVQKDLGNVILTAGKIYIQGDVLPVEQAVLADVAMTGRVEIGVRITRSYQTHEDDPDLTGPVPGSLAEGEPGAARESVSIAWAQSGDGGAGEFVPVYVLQDGTILDQSDPAVLDGYAQAIAVYDRDAHGHYIVRGCQVTALGKAGVDQVFSISQGIANIYGFKVTRTAALRFAEPEDWDVETVDGEPHIYNDDAGSCTISLAHTPIASVANVLITKETTENVVRGATSNGSDALGFTGVTEILSVTQGGTTYQATTDYVRAGDAVDWSAAGDEPQPGSSYAVTYRYLDAVQPDNVTDTTVTVANGVDGETVIVSYDFKLPRLDALCLNRFGEAVYVKGISARDNLMPPVAPADLLPLATIANSWTGKPTVTNDGVRAVNFAEAWRYYNRILDHERLIQLERLKSAIDQREPVAKKGTFVDPFTDDTYRDQGEAQNAAIGGGVMELAIDPTFHVAALAEPVMLDWVEEVIVAQELATACEAINPYQNFTPIPASLALDPPADFWVSTQTEWTSAQTVEFNRGVNRSLPIVGSATTEELVDHREEPAEFLRQIGVDFTIAGFAPGEELTELSFAGVDVTPPGPLTAGPDGGITGSLVIPSNVPAGSVSVIARGSGSSQASALFTGSGLIETDIMRRVTTLRRDTTTVAGRLDAIGGAVGVGASGGADPQAQTFALPETRQIAGIDFKLCAVGSETNPILVDQVGVETGIPTTRIAAEAFVAMAGAAVGWKAARYNLPVLANSDRHHAFVIKTDDASHAIGIARLGDYDFEAESWVSAQPYSVGVRLSSSNAETWTPHQDSDVSFRIVAAKFTNPTKTVPLGSFDLVDASDLSVRAGIELPSADCSVRFEIVRANGQVWGLRPYQVLQLSEYVTETVQLRAVLTGTEKLSPILYAPVILVAGKIRASGTYVSRAFKLGAGVRLTSYMKARLPAGSSLSVEYDHADGNWLALPLVETEALADPAWVEEKHEASAITATEGRMRLTITGGPDARPLIGDLGAAVM